MEYKYTIELDMIYTIDIILLTKTTARKYNPRTL